MKHVTALIYKWIFTVVILMVVLTWMERVTFGQAFFLSLVVTGALYVSGDLFVLPLFGNVSATLADAAVAYLLIRFAPAYSSLKSVNPGPAVVATLFIGVAEYFFHRYLVRKVLPGAPAGRVDV